jgi:hypothetical protein
MLLPCMRLPRRCPTCPARTARADAPAMPPAPFAAGLALGAAHNFALVDRGSLEISSKFASNCFRYDRKIDQNEHPYQKAVEI